MALRLAEGNPGKRAMKGKGVTAAPELPACPKGLDSEAMREWNRLALVMFRLGILTGLDRAALGVYCQNYSVWIQAVGKAKKDGLVVDVNGGLQANPYLGIANRAAEQMRKYMTEMGLTPASRASLVVSEKGGDDLDDFLNQNWKAG
jgi:P27 family predicted phage terminase small subunit